jgi:glycosyltransferase involved in cell wall biosynthesis
MATTSGASSEVTCLTDDDPEPRGAWSKRAYRLDRRLRRRLLNRAAFLVAQSEAAADELSRVVPRERIVVIPTPVELLVPPPLTGAPRAVFTGRLSRDKDLLRLLDAWHDVAGRHPGSLLTLVGDGGPHQSVEHALRQRVAQDAELTATVRFTGWVADVSPFLADSDVFVFPSLSEGMSNSLLEACAWGRVVVASDIPANREALGDDYPLLFPAGDAAALARALLRSFDDADARRAARTRVTARAEELSLDRAVERLEPLLRASQHRARVS